MNNLSPYDKYAQMEPDKTIACIQIHKINTLRINEFLLKSFREHDLVNSIGNLIEMIDHEK